MIQHPKKERTFVIIKPDGIQRSLIGEIVSRFERTGLKLTGMKLVHAEEKKLWSHYNKDDAWYEEKGAKIIFHRKEAGLAVEKDAKEYGKEIIGALVQYMSVAPVVMMVWEGNQAVGIVKKLVGSTEPLASDVGTIRGDLTLDSYATSSIDDRAVRNLIHCSDSPREAQREISIWFQADECFSYRLIAEQILYDVNLDGLKE